MPAASEAAPTIHQIRAACAELREIQTRYRIDIKNPMHIAVIAILTQTTGSDAVPTSYLDAMLIDDLGADPWLDGEEIANALEERFDISLDDDNPLRDPMHMLPLRVRDVIAFIADHVSCICTNPCPGATILAWAKVMRDAGREIV